MFKALVIFIVIASILMIGIVLIQKSKGGGLASNYASSNQILGVRKTNSFVEKSNLDSRNRNLRAQHPFRFLYRRHSG